MPTFIIRDAFFWAEADTDEQAVAVFRDRIALAFPDNSDYDLSDAFAEEWDLEG